MNNTAVGFELIEALSLGKCVTGVGPELVFGLRAVGSIHHLPPVGPSEHKIFSQMVPLPPNRPFPGPESLSPRHPKPAFSDNSPFLEDSGILFLGAAAGRVANQDRQRIERSEVIQWGQVSAARQAGGEKQTKQVSEAAKRAAVQPEGSYVDLNLTREGGRGMVFALR